MLTYENNELPITHDPFFLDFGLNKTIGRLEVLARQEVELPSNMRYNAIYVNPTIGKKSNYRIRNQTFK